MLSGKGPQENQFMTTIEPAGIKERLVDFGFTYGTQIIGAVLILTVGYVVASWLGKITRRWLERHDMEPPVRMLIVRLVWLVVMVFTLVAMLQKVGVEVLPM